MSYFIDPLKKQLTICLYLTFQPRSQIPPSSRPTLGLITRLDLIQEINGLKPKQMLNWI